MSDKVRFQIRLIMQILVHSVKKFLQIDGVMWGAAFAYNAFFSLFPMIILFITAASLFIDQVRATTEIISYVERYVPMSDEMHRHIFNTITGVVTARKQASSVALFILVVVAAQSFKTLINATNRAWDTAIRSWWRLPIKSLVLFGALASAVFLGIMVPILLAMVSDWLFIESNFVSRALELGTLFIPFMTIFFSLSLVYKYAPRRLTRFSEVWIGALCATVLLSITERLFVIYMKYVGTANAVYGLFGGIMALLMWIYLSGCIFIFGGCLCAAQATIPAQSAPSQEQT